MKRDYNFNTLLGKVPKKRMTKSQVEFLEIVGQDTWFFPSPELLRGLGLPRETCQTLADWGVLLRRAVPINGNIEMEYMLTSHRATDYGIKGLTEDEA